METETDEEYRERKDSEAIADVLALLSIILASVMVAVPFVAVWWLTAWND